MTTHRAPLVSVVTPFYDSAETLGECIRSVLSQSYGTFEYVLVDNRSTDEGFACASEYAALDPRIRLVQNAMHLDQLPNYNAALRLISPESRYVKMVQADDMILEGCLERMVAAAEAHPSAAIVGSYYLKGTDLRGGGLPLSTHILSGRDACRLHLLEGRYLFGSPSTLLYRADLVRSRPSFFDERSRISDSELCYEALKTSDFAFVHQVLSYLRVAEDSIQSSLSKYNWELLGFYVLLHKFGPRFLSPEELSATTRRIRTDYLRYLAESRIARREYDFWEQHRRALESLGQSLPGLSELAPHLAGPLARAALRPWRRKH